MHLSLPVVFFVFFLLAVAWHPVHESLFASGGGDGSILFWTIGYVGYTAILAF